VKGNCRTRDCSRLPRRTASPCALALITSRLARADCGETAQRAEPEDARVGPDDRSFNPGCGFESDGPAIDASARVGSYIVGPGQASAAERRASPGAQLATVSAVGTGAGCALPDGCGRSPAGAICRNAETPTITNIAIIIIANSAVAIRRCADPVRNEVWPLQTVAGFGILPTAALMALLQPLTSPGGREGRSGGPVDAR
jgi:hypothetical protein